MFLGLFILYFLNIANCNINKPGSEVLGIETGKEPDWSYSSIPNEVRPHVQEFKRNLTECLKEVQANDKRKIKRLSPKMESPVHGECVIACILKRNAVIDNGKVHKDQLITFLSKFYSKEDKLIKKLERNIDRCINMNIRSKDECLLASSLNECTNKIIMGNNKHTRYI